MAELLSREKEFIQLNQELDQLNVTSLDQQNQHNKQPLQYQETHCNGVTDSCSAGSGVGIASGSGIYNGISKQSTLKNEQRYYTYTKSKGASTLLKKRTNGPVVAGVSAGGGGGGDGTADVISDLPTERKINTHRMVRKVIQHSTTSTTPSIRPDANGGLTAQSETPKSTRTNSTMHRKHVKSPESGTRTLNRGSNCNSRTKESTFTVKYRNPKFVQSPSLEVLIRDECNAINKNGSDDFDESINSNGGCVSRRSMDTSKKRFSADGLIKFLKSKIAILEEDHERISQEMSQQKEMLEKTLERNKKLEQQRDQAFAKHNAMAEQLNKTEIQLDDVNRRLKERNLEHGAHQKELEVARREIKVLSQTNTNLEKRLYRANEELENTKSALALIKNAERELKESIRVDGEAKDKQIKSLKKQRADLLNAYKKQLFLIDNLKRQNICMEQSKMINFGEKEFTKVLEWNTKL